MTASYTSFIGTYQTTIFYGFLFLILFLLALSSSLSSLQYVLLSDILDSKKQKCYSKHCSCCYNCIRLLACKTQVQPTMKYVSQHFVVCQRPLLKSFSAISLLELATVNLNWPMENGRESQLEYSGDPDNYHGSSSNEILDV
ncbi:hypothetical protein SLA2020_147030 [Shorea laevis]